MSLVEQAIARLRQANADKLAAGEPSRDPSRPAFVRKPIAEVFADPLRTSTKRLTIDSDALRAAGYLPEAGHDRPFAEQYRQIKRPLIEKAMSGSREGTGDYRLIMVSSALPGDGKTFTSLNLALSMARERDVSVLLIDADIPKRHLSEIFGIDSEIGLTDALTDETLDVESLVMVSNIRGFSILPSGKFVEGGAELLTSNRMRQLVNSLTTYSPRRLLIMDAPPLLITSEGRALLKVAGQTLLVVRAGHTPRQAVQDALALFDEKQEGGIVLNEAETELTDGYYGYGDYGKDKNAPPANS